MERPGSRRASTPSRAIRVGEVLLVDGRNSKPFLSSNFWVVGRRRWGRQMMTKSLDDVVAKRPVDREKVDALKKEMLEGARSYRLRELREKLDLT